MSYDLRRLHLHGLIERIPGSHRFQVTDFGLKAALFLTRAHARLIRVGLADILTPVCPSQPRCERSTASRPASTISPTLHVAPLDD